MYMKKILLITMLSGLAAVSLHAQPFWFDSMSYSNNITTNSGGLWIRHSGTANDSLALNYAGVPPAAAAGFRYEVNQTKTDDVHRWLDPVATNGNLNGMLFSSFIVSVTTLPANPSGTYFAHFMDTVVTNAGGGGTEFRGRVFAIVPPNPYPFTNTVANTYRLGIANAAGDYSAGTGTGGPNVIVPVDLALNTDYQVVVKYDLDNAIAYLYVNPASEADSANSSGGSGDTGAVATPLTAFAFRQSTGEGILEIKDVKVGTAFTDVADVATNLPVTPVVSRQPVSVTNYSGSPALLEVLGTGQATLSYQWYHGTNGVGTNAIAGANSQKYNISGLQASDEGIYYCIVANGAGSNTSASAYVSVNNTPTPPTFTVQPPSTGSFFSLQTMTLTCAAYGTGPLSYQWFLNGTPLSDGKNADSSTTSGSQSPTLTIAAVGTAEAGTYTVTVTGGVAPPATSGGTVVTVLPPQIANIGYLRTLVDPTTWQPTNTTTIFTVRGVITTLTNLSSGQSSYYLQDGTGGLNLFIGGTTAFRPNMGDVVEANGKLAIFNNNLELSCSTADPAQTFKVVTAGGTALPAPIVFNPNLTNNAGLMETNLEGCVIMLTNVFFTNAVAASTGTGQTTIAVTNANGVGFLMFFPGGQDVDVRSRPYPAFAWTVTGVLNQFKSGTYSSAGYEIAVSRWQDVVTTPPPAVTVTATRSGNNILLTWPAVPYTTLSSGAYAYSVRAATDVNGPYLPLATGLTFTNTTGSFSDTVTGPTKFYKVSSP
jgi:hypothetical protein